MTAQPDHYPPTPQSTPANTPPTDTSPKHTDKVPTFNLKVVVNETGLKPDTLRAWERRYGLPDPVRTSGGHRLYSQRDIDILKWLVTRQNEGLSISRAVKLWRHLEASGSDPLLHDHPTLPDVPAPSVSLSRVGDTVESMQQAWMQSCLDFNEHQADGVLSQAFALFTIETVCLDILQKSLAHIGQGWYEGRISIQQEHFASVLAVRRIETLVAATPPPTRHGRILIACPPEERHTFTLLLLTLFLRRNGWDVVYLGANVPLDRLVNTIATIKPSLVILSAQTLHTASTMLPMVLVLQRERILCAYGGAVFNFLPQLRQRIPAHFLGEQLKGAVGRAEQLISLPPAIPNPVVAPRAYKVALEHFKTRQASVEAYMWQHVTDSQIQTYLKNANKDLAQNITAALIFGDMSLLSTNLEWLHGLLVNYHYRMPERAMHAYMSMYRDACEAHLDERGQIITNWLHHVLSDTV